MKREDWQKAYAPASGALETRVKHTLTSLGKETERSRGMKKIWAIALVAVLALSSVVALAAGIVLSGKADAVQLADRAMEETYGITQEMMTYFSRSEQEKPDGSVIVTYKGIENFAYVLGEYTVTVSGGKAEAAWSRDGESTEGGLDATAWGAAQLQIALDTVRATNGFGEAGEKATAHAQAAGRANAQMPLPEENPAPAGYESWHEYNATQAMLRAQIAPAELIALGKAAIIERYALTEQQVQRMEIHDIWTSFEMAGEIPVMSVWFSLWQNPGQPWTQGDGLYGADVNAETGVIEELYYDSTLGGNG